MTDTKMKKGNWKNFANVTIAKKRKKMEKNEMVPNVFHQFKCIR